MAATSATSTKESSQQSVLSLFCLSYRVFILVVVHFVLTFVLGLGRIQGTARAQITFPPPILGHSTRTRGESHLLMIGDPGRASPPSQWRGPFHVYDSVMAHLLPQ